MNICDLRIQLYFAYFVKQAFETEKMTRTILFLFFILPGAGSFAGTNDEQHGKIEVKCASDSTCKLYIRDSRIYTYGLDTLQNIKFWRTVIKLDPDSGLINVGHTRQVLGVIPSARYSKMGSVKQDLWRDSIRKANNFPDSTRIVFTAGLNHYYLFDKVMPQINDAIRIFEEHHTDPFYAQAILLIESPGQLLKSPAGAYGPFQLMKGVARAQGLTVNKYVDERKDFNRSAYAAAKLLREVCIPYTNSMLDAKGICYNENDLWYKLLVLHVYHAGAGNVGKALDKMSYCEQDGDMGLIKELWNTKAAAFGSVSQKYSQVALACLIELDERLNKSSEKIEWVGK
jgi:hypothetical protein